MIVAISYHQGDLPLMTRWANHVVKLGPYINHQIVLLPVHEVCTEKIESILRGSFSNVSVEKCYHTESGWPVSCNKAFETMAWAALQRFKAPFLWMEPDAIPLSSDWIDRIEAEYSSQTKPFMGDFVQIAGIMPNGVDHMSGIAVYHWNMPLFAPSIFRNESVAWDIMSAKDVVPKMHRTSLIQHDWVPTEKWRRDSVDSSCVKPGAVIYHPDKLGVLFNDGLSPNGVQGDPATGGSSSPHETKVKPSTSIALKEIKDFLETKTLSERVDMALDSLVNHAKENTKIKKQVINRLIAEGILKAPKAKSSKQSGKKVRLTLGKRGRPRSGNGVSVSPDPQVAG